jgi:hypothetical protein
LSRIENAVFHGVTPTSGVTGVTPTSSAIGVTLNSSVTTVTPGVDIVRKSFRINQIPSLADISIHKIIFESTKKPQKVVFDNSNLLPTHRQCGVEYVAVILQNIAATQETKIRVKIPPGF